MKAKPKTWSMTFPDVTGFNAWKPVEYHFDLCTDERKKYPATRAVNPNIVRGDGLTVIYKGKRGWYWRSVDKNGNIVAISGEPELRPGRVMTNARRHATPRFATVFESALPFKIKIRK